MNALTLRQLQVLRLAAEGMTNREIGTRLNISPETVESHFMAIRKKLGARDRANAVHLAHQVGCI